MFGCRPPSKILSILSGEMLPGPAYGTVSTMLCVTPISYHTQKKGMR